MKSIIPALLLLCLTTSSFSQRVQSSCTAPDSIVSLYADDAAKLALAHLYEKNTSYSDSTDIPQSLQDTFLRSLIAVYNSGLKATDTILGRARFVAPDGYGIYETIFIHNESYSSCNRLSIDYVDTTVHWENNLIHGVNPTGNMMIDSMVTTYGIRFDSVDQYNHYWFHTSKFYNMTFIVERWNEITSGYPNASYLMAIGPRFTISAHINDSSVSLLYKYGWGDCPSGCISWHAWSYTVFNDCSVQYDSSFGVTLPVSAVSTELTKAKQLVISPNPGSQQITMRLELLTKIEIIDVTGNILQAIQSNSDQEEIDVSVLPKGIYFIRATDKKGNISAAKFIKE